MEDDCRERGEEVHVVDGPEPGVVRPQEVDVVRQEAEVDWSSLEYYI